MARCDTNSYWLCGVKVRSGTSEALVDGAWRRVVCDKAEGSEINVQEVPDGSAVRLAGFGVLQFDANRWRGRAGRRVPFVETATSLPQVLRVPWALRVAEHRDDLEALKYLTHTPGVKSDDLKRTLARSGRSWKKLATSSSLNDHDLMMMVASHAEAIKDPQVLSFLARNASGMQATRWGAMWALCSQGRADLAVEAALERLYIYNSSDDAECASRLLQHEDAVLHSPSIGDALAVRWPSVLLTAIAYGTGGGSSRPWSVDSREPRFSPRVAESLLRSTKLLSAEQIDQASHRIYISALTELHRSGAAEARAILEMHGHGVDDSAQRAPLRKAPVFVDSNLHRAAARAAFDAWQEVVRNLSDGQIRPDAEGWELWAQLGRRAGLPEHVWSAAPFSTTGRSRIAAVLGESELRELVDHSYRTSKAQLLARINDTELWRAETSAHLTREMCEHMPVSMLAEVLEQNRDAPMVREVATARGVLDPAEAVHDEVRAVQVQALLKTRDQSVIKNAVLSDVPMLAAIAARRCLETETLRTAQVSWEGRDDEAAAAVRTRLFQVESFDAVFVSLERGEIDVARALVERITDEDLLIVLAGRADLSRWATARLMKVQTARMLERSKSRRSLVP